MSLSAEDCLWAAVESDDDDDDADADAAEAVQQAIRDGADVHSVRCDSTPLMEACKHGSDQIIRIFLDAGADARWRDSYGSSAISYACENGHLPAVQLLINHDNGLLETVDDQGWTPLILAIRQQDSDVVRLLLERGANPHHTDQEGITAFMRACGRGSLEIVRLMLAADVDVEARDQCQNTALHYAACWDRIDVWRELIRQHNANMFALNGYGRTPYDMACVQWRNDAAIDRLLEIYSNKWTQDHGRLALHELLNVAEYSFAEDEEFHPPLNPLQIILPLGKLALTHLRTLIHSLDPELIRTRNDTGKLPIHIACQTNAPVEVLALLFELDPTALHIVDYTGALPIHLLCDTTTAATECASVRYLIQSFPESMAVQTNAGDYPFMVAASDSSSASLSVVYELVRADPDLIKGMPANPV